MQAQTTAVISKSLLNLVRTLLRWHRSPPHAVTNSDQHAGLPAHASLPSMACRGVALRVDHLEPGEVSTLIGRVDAEQGQLDILVNDIIGGGAYAESDRSYGSMTCRAGCGCCAWASTLT